MNENYIVIQLKMPVYKCEKCFKIFNLKTDLERHKNKKNSCSFSCMMSNPPFDITKEELFSSCMMSNPPFGIKLKGILTKEELLLTIIKHYF